MAPSSSAAPTPLRLSLSAVVGGRPDSAAPSPSLSSLSSSWEEVYFGGEDGSSEVLFGPADVGAGGRVTDRGVRACSFALRKPYWNEWLLAVAGIPVVGYKLHTQE